MSEHNVTFEVEGVESENDAQEIEDELSELEGTLGTSVDRERGEVEMKIEDELLSEERVKITIDELGYEVE